MLVNYTCLWSTCTTNQLIPWHVLALQNQWFYWINVQWRKLSPWLLIPVHNYISFHFEIYCQIKWKKKTKIMLAFTTESSASKHQLGPIKYWEAYVTERLSNELTGCVKPIHVRGSAYPFPTRDRASRERQSKHVPSVLPAGHGQIWKNEPTMSSSWHNSEHHQHKEAIIFYSKTNLYRNYHIPQTINEQLAAILLITRRNREMIWLTCRFN